VRANQDLMCTRAAVVSRRSVGRVLNYEAELASRNRVLTTFPVAYSSPLSEFHGHVDEDITNFRHSVILRAPAGYDRALGRPKHRGWLERVQCYLL
jgi:hypothetical protein